MERNMVSNNKEIGSLRGLKVIAMLLLFWWHSTIPGVFVDLGARTCEFFFICSGFLVAYNHHNDMAATYKQSFYYIKKKLCKMWPLHITGFAISCIILLLEKVQLFNLDTFLTAIINIFFLQSWSVNRNIFYSFNGVSWFLSSILFCYFCSPFLLKFLKNKRTSYITFFMILALRIIIENIQGTLSPDLTLFYYHVFPVNRLIEFWLGILLFSFFEYFHADYINKGINRQKHENITGSIVEIITLIVSIYLVIRNNNLWPRWGFVALLCFFIFVFSFDKGIISKLLGGGMLRHLSSIELEFFVLHQVFIRLFLHFLQNKINWILLNGLTFLTIMLFCFLWHGLISRKTSQLMNTIFLYIDHWMYGEELE